MTKRFKFHKQCYTKILLILAVAIGTWQVAEGAYIYAKAQLAQYLLASAWQQSKQTQQLVKPWSWADTWPVAKLEVSAHNIELIVLAGDSGRTLAFGPGYNQASATPGDVGNSIISAHRDTHFEFLQYLKLDDEIIIENPQGLRKRFAINKIHIVDSRKTGIDTNHESAMLTLVTCYPFDAYQTGGPLRYVVEAEEVSVELRA